MTLASARIVLQGETPYAHEREAIEFALSQLPNTDPYHLWALVELVDPSSGRVYEIDLLILGYSALYLVEVKSGPGKYSGDFTDWWRTPPEPGARPHYMDPPLRLTNLKAKVLKSRLVSKLRDRRHAPWVEPLVFLSHPDTDVSDLRPDGRVGVVTRSEFLRAVTHHEFPGADPSRRPRRIDRPAARDIAEALRAIGIKPREGKALVKEYVLGSVLEDGPGYQDRAAEHRAAQMRCRARTYLVPQQTSVERRQQLRRAADREAALLYDVREHPGVLRITDYVTDAPLGPTVLFDDFAGGVPLAAFLRTHPELPLDDRATLVEQVGRALAHCHKKGVIHGALSPEAVLVRRTGAGTLETRLFNFQLGMSEQVDATTHWSALASEPWALYQAPELRENPAARSVASDVFSLGALAYFVFTGRPPAQTLGEYLKRLHVERQLDPRAVDGDMNHKLADLIAQTTDVTLLNRIDEADFFVEEMLEALTGPGVAPPGDELDPLMAAKEMFVGGDLLVEGLLGHGATSRVLLVERTSDSRQYALKVSLATEHDPRLDREAEVLQNLRHPRIVQLVDRRTIAGRSCLLLTLAGGETLHRYLAREGTVSLDLASRYGEDLLLALEYLEDEQVLHRDIKPANIGIGTASKKGYHLTLFDFSLASSAVTDLSVGTALYRDPFLAERGAWDFAAERWSAAVTLHEMLTGARPHYGEQGTASIDADAKLELSAERFDPAVRDSLQRFFERALARDVNARFDSAKQMRHAWIACFDVAARREPIGRTKGATASDPPPAQQLTDEQIAAIAPDTPLGALPLSSRAQSALDRSGVLTAGDLLYLADNHISAIRGIGRKVAREILAFRNRWRALRAIEPGPIKPFYPGYRGADLMVTACAWSPDIASALWDAGLHTLRALAAAPKEQIGALARRHRFDLRELKKTLAHEHDRAGEEEEPSSLASWIDALLPSRTAGTRYLLALFGLGEPFVGRLDVRNKDVAKHFGVTPAAVSIALSEARERWEKRATIREVVDACHRILDEAHGALPIAKLAEELVSCWPGGPQGAAELERARAAALARVVCELEKNDPTALALVRLRDDAPWLLASDALAPVVRALGAAADKLASRSVLASPGEVQRILGELVAGTSLELAGAERLTELAAAASNSAARSPRLEIYPRGMPAARALELSAAVLRSGLSAIHIFARVKSRYPEAEPLPDRPELDELLAPYGLKYNRDLGVYQRPSEGTSSGLSTDLSSLTHLPSSVASPVHAPDARLIAKTDFEERIRNALERRALRMLAVTTDRAELAALSLASRFDLEMVSLDTALIAEMRQQMKLLKIPDDRVVHAADVEGPTGNAWPNLMMLVERAAHALASRIFPPKRPLLLVQPGLLARYRLESFLDQLVAASKRDDSQAIFLLVPAHDSGGVPAINGQLAVRGILPAQVQWIPRAWLAAVQGETAA